MKAVFVSFPRNISPLFDCVICLRDALSHLDFRVSEQLLNSVDPAEFPGGEFYIFDRKSP